MFRAHVLVVRRPKLYYTVSGIITPIGGRPVHGLRCTVSKISIFLNRFSNNHKKSNFIKINLVGSELCGRTDGQKDMTKLIVAFRSLANTRWN